MAGIFALTVNHCGGPPKLFQRQKGDISIKIVLVRVINFSDFHDAPMAMGMGAVIK
jgi:hypothetical protein